MLTQVPPFRHGLDLHAACFEIWHIVPEKKSNEYIHINTETVSTNLPNRVSNDKQKCFRDLGKYLRFCKCCDRNDCPLSYKFCLSIRFCIHIQSQLSSRCRYHYFCMGSDCTRQYLKLEYKKYRIVKPIFLNYCKTEDILLSFVRVEDLLILQSAPSQPSLHMHWNAFTLSTQVPPFSQGFILQSFISEEKQLVYIGIEYLWETYFHGSIFRCIQVHTDTNVQFQ